MKSIFDIFPFSLLHSMNLDWIVEQIKSIPSIIRAEVLRLISSGVIEGSKGDRGPRGPEGNKGVDGPEGERGPKGPRGPRGGLASWGSTVLIASGVMESFKGSGSRSFGVSYGQLKNYKRFVVQCIAESNVSDSYINFGGGNGGVYGNARSTTILFENVGSDVWHIVTRFSTAYPPYTDMNNVYTKTMYPARMADNSVMLTDIFANLRFNMDAISDADELQIYYQTQVTRPEFSYWIWAIEEV